MLPAERGDALLVEYGPGSPDAIPSHRVLVDGGPVNSGQYDLVRERLARIPVGADGRRHFDLLIVTHVDADHVEGVIRLLQDRELRCVFDDVWFDGWRHLAAIDPASTVAVLGPTQGEFLGALLRAQGRPWNQYVSGGPIVVPDDGPLPVVDLRGGMRLTVVSPTVPKLRRLARVWADAVRDAGFEPGDADAAVEQLSSQWWARPPVLGTEAITASDDSSEANGSSIAVLAEYGGRSLLLTGDAHDDVLVASLRRLRAERGGADDEPVRVDGCKLPHHGSSKNVTRQLLAELRADAYLVSTSGDRFQHPDASAIGTIRRAHGDADPPTILFNYRQPNTEIWEPLLEARFGDDAILRLPTAP